MGFMDAIQSVFSEGGNTPIRKRVENGDSTQTPGIAPPTNAEGGFFTKANDAIKNFLGPSTPSESYDQLIQDQASEKANRGGFLKEMDKQYPHRKGRQTPTPTGMDEFLSKPVIRQANQAYQDYKQNKKLEAAKQRTSGGSTPKTGKQGPLEKFPKGNKYKGNPLRNPNGPMPIRGSGYQGGTAYSMTPDLQFAPQSGEYLDPLTEEILNQIVPLGAKPKLRGFLPNR